MIIKNCKLVNSDSSESIKDILVSNGKIIKIEDSIDSSSETEVIDAKLNYVLPGIIDCHTHMRDPGFTYKEDAETGSKGCAKGGVTTFIDMPNTNPNTASIEILADKKNIYKARTYVDYGFNFGGLKTDNSDEVLKAKDLVATTKIFLNVSTGNMLVEDDEVLYNIFKNSKMVSVHAEEEMVDKAIKIATETNKPLIICHTSLASEAEYIRKAKAKKLNVFGEVTPHHLFMNENDRDQNEETKMLYRMKPELKTAKDNEALWEALRDGTIDTIGTDHAPHTYEEKLEKVIFGMPGVESSLELMLTAVDSGKISMPRLIEVMCHNPALIFKIKDKGFLKEGYDADIIIVDRNNKTKFTQEEIVSKANWSPYLGKERGGKVLTTIVRGNIVYNNGKFNDKIGEEIKYYD